MVKKKAFTLAEVLITLGIIGIVAEMTIPTLVSNFDEQVYKTAYKKAYSELSQVFYEAISENKLTPRTTSFDETATASEWNVIKDGFKVQKECSRSDLNICWADGEYIYLNRYPSSDASTGSYSFIDASGRSWAEYNYHENIYLVDTNGFKNPNQFGKDRWIFTLWNANNTRNSTGIPAKVGIFQNNDILSTSADWCNHPPCYYKSWLFN